MNDDDLTQLMLVRSPSRAAAAPNADSVVQHAVAIGAPSVGSRSAGETFFGDTDVGADLPAVRTPSAATRKDDRGDPSLPGVHRLIAKAQGARAYGVRRGVVFAALGGIALALGLSLRTQERAPPAPSGAPSKETPPAIDAKGALAPPPPVDTSASSASLVHVFTFEMSQQEAQWAQRAHAAAQLGDCQEALELYQRLVNLSAATKETGAVGVSRWLPFLEQVRRRCWADRGSHQLGPGAL